MSTDRSVYMNEYREKNKDSLNEYHKNYRKNNMSKIMVRNEKCGQERLKEWEGYIPIQTQCQVCGKDIFFNRGKFQDRIHFDHRHGGIEIIKHPTLWLKGNPRSHEKEKIWESCDFGMLCLLCNRSLPTKNRKLYVDGVVRYFNN